MGGRQAVGQRATISSGRNLRAKEKETKAGNWDQRIRNQKLSQDKFGRRILDGSKDEEMEDVPGWFVDNHPNANGVKIIADEEFKTITRLWPKRLPTAARK